MKDVTAMTVEELNLLYEHLYVAIGPRRMHDRAEALRNVRHALAVARELKISMIVDPLDQPNGAGGSEASKRYKLYRDADTVEKFILTHGDGGHLRLDVQRGNIAVAHGPTVGHLPLMD